MLGQFTRKHEANSSLDLSGGEGGLLVVAGKTRSLRRNTIEDIVDEGVHDGHASLGDTSLLVNLLEHLVDVRRVRLDSLLASCAGGLLGGLDALLAGSFCHFDE